MRDFKRDARRFWRRVMAYKYMGLVGAYAAAVFLWGSITTIVCHVLVLFMGALASVLLIQDSFLYLNNATAINGNRSPAANPPHFRTPGEWEFLYEDVDLSPEPGVSLRGWWIPVATASPAPPAAVSAETEAAPVPSISEAPSISIPASFGAGGIASKFVPLPVPDSAAAAAAALVAANAKAAALAASAAAAVALTTRPIVLYLHGNSGNVGYCLPIVAFLRTRVRAHVLLVDYRGYGASTGSPSQRGLRADALAMLLHARERALLLLQAAQEAVTAANTAADVADAAAVDALGRTTRSSKETLARALERRIRHRALAREQARARLSSPPPVLLWGCSMGGAVATWLAAQPIAHSRVSGVVLENTFTDSLSAGIGLVPVFSPLLEQPELPAGAAALLSSAEAATTTSSVSGSGFIGKLLRAFSARAHRVITLFQTSPWRSIDAIHMCPQPLLLLSGALDTMVPPRHMTRMCARAGRRAFLPLAAVDDSGSRSNSRDAHDPIASERSAFAPLLSAHVYNPQAHVRALAVRAATLPLQLLRVLLLPTAATPRVGALAEGRVVVACTLDGGGLDLYKAYKPFVPRNSPPISAKGAVVSEYARQAVLDAHAAQMLKNAAAVASSDACAAQQVRLWMPCAAGLPGVHITEAGGSMSLPPPPPELPSMLVPFVAACVKADGSQGISRIADEAAQAAGGRVDWHVPSTEKEGRVVCERAPEGGVYPLGYRKALADEAKAWFPSGSEYGPASTRANAGAIEDSYRPGCWDSGVYVPSLQWLSLPTAGHHNCIQRYGKAVASAVGVLVGEARGYAEGKGAVDQESDDDEDDEDRDSNEDCGEGGADGEWAEFRRDVKWSRSCIDFEREYVSSRSSE